MSQILRGHQATLILTTYDEGTQSDLGTFTIGIEDLAGNEIVAPGTAVTDNGDGTYEYELAPQSDLKFLKATWTEQAGNVEFVTWYEIVGAFLFTEAQARAFQDGRLEEVAKFGDDDIAAERIRATDWLEANTGVSWVPRYRRAVLSGNGSDHISLYRILTSEGPSGGEGAHRDILKVLSLTIGDEAKDLSKVEAHGHELWLTEGTFTHRRRPGNVVVEYEYGLRHLRGGVDRIALLELVERMPARRLSSAATDATDEFGTYSWQPQNNGRPSRNPEVNAWLRDQDIRVAIA